MRNGMLGKLTAMRIVAMLSAGIAACDSNSGVERASSTQAGTDALPSARSYAAQQDVLRAERDAARGIVWVLHAHGADVHDAARNRKVASVALPQWTWASEAYACPPDLTLSPDGSAVVTSNVMPVIWRIDAASFEVTRHELSVDEHSGKDVGFSGLTYSPRHGAFFAMGGLDASVWRIDASLARARRVALSAPMPHACGVSALSRVSRAAAPETLCAQTEFGEWTVELAPDGASGRVQRARCWSDREGSQVPGHVRRPR